MEIINPNEIGSKISTLILESEKKCNIVSPYLNLSEWKKITVNLKNAIKRGVEIKIYFREINDNDFRTLKRLKVELIHIKNLHTKLYFNEKKFIVTSMNLNEVSDLYYSDIAMSFDDEKDYNKLYEYYRKHIKTENRDVYLNQNFKDNLSKLHGFLEGRFPNARIGKSSSYLYTKDLIPVFHLFIQPERIGIKYPIKNPDEERVIELKKIINKFCSEKIDYRSYNTTEANSYHIWEVYYKINDFTKILDIISDLKKINNF